MRILHRFNAALTDASIVARAHTFPCLLRERREEIPALLQHYLQEFGGEQRRVT
jgi:hypothetical protein